MPCLLGLSLLCFCLLFIYTNLFVQCICDGESFPSAIWGSWSVCLTMYPAHLGLCVYIIHSEAFPPFWSFLRDGGPIGALPLDCIQRGFFVCQGYFSLLGQPPHLRMCISGFLRWSVSHLGAPFFVRHPLSMFCAGRRTVGAACGIIPSILTDDVMAPPRVASSRSVVPRRDALVDDVAAPPRLWCHCAMLCAMLRRCVVTSRHHIAPCAQT